MLGEVYDILRAMPISQLNFFAKIRLSDEDWKIFKEFSLSQKQIKMDEIYRLNRPRSQDDMIKNQIDQEYYKGRIADLIILLQIMENASHELERREKKVK